MAKSLVEKYEQILESDPGSLVFIELAKALIERGAATRAVEVCRRGLEHHPDSMVGMVLCGKALISCGQPAEAMEQFDKAIALEPSNPQAYNLIGEVLLHKGLHRSALPILRKAVSLQPNDGRVRQWFDQAQRAVNGLPPAPVEHDKTEVDLKAEAKVGAPTDPGLEPTVTEMSAYVPGETVPGLTDVFRSLGAREGAGAQAGAAETASAEAASPASGAAEASAGGSGTAAASTVLADLPSVVVSMPAEPSADSPDVPAARQETSEDQAKPGPQTPAASEAAPLAADPQPAAAVEAAPASPPAQQQSETPPAAAGKALSDAERTVAEFEASGGLDVVPGLTGVFQSLSAREEGEAKQAKSDPFADWDSGPPPQAAGHAEVEPASSATPTVVTAAVEPPPSKPPPPPPPLPRTASQQNLPAAEAGAPPPLPRVPAAPPLPKRPGLLDELPPDPDGAEEEPRETALPGDLEPGRGPALSMEMPSVVLASETAEEIAREYERELREKLLATPPPTFWRKYWLPVSLTGALLVALALGLTIYAGTRRQNRGNDLIELRSQAYRALSLETPGSYRHAVELAERVLELAPEDVDAKAARAFAHAALFRDFGEDPSRKKEAETGIEEFRTAHPGLALAIPYLVASEPGAIDEAKLPLLQVDPQTIPAGFERAVALSLAGRVQLAAGKQEEALLRFQDALSAHAGHVGTLMALGDYYFWQTEPTRALEFYRLAKTASPDHVKALMGVVLSELALGRGTVPAEDLQAARAAFAAAKEAGAEWPSSLASDLDLAEGRVFALQGKHEEAISRLTAGAAEHASRSAEFWAAIGAVEAQTGNFDKAEAAYLRAAAKRPADPQIKEELARALIARGRPADALKATEGAPESSRSIRIVRGLARLELGQLGKAREELVATERNGKFPAEAAVYLARIDAAQEQRETARAMLESVASTSKEWASLAQGALGALHLAEGREAEALAAFTKAAQDPRDWEGSCAMGRLLLKAGRYADARGPLQTAVDRNRFHPEARVALGEVLLALGEAARAQAEFAATLELGPSAIAHRGTARALLAQGNLDEARRSAAAAARLDRRSPDANRLAAQLALASGDAQEAIRGLERAAKADPRDPSGWCELGEILVKVGEQRAARQAFGAALKLDKSNLRGRLGIVNAALPKEAGSVRRDSDALVNETATAEPAIRSRALALNARVLLALKDKKLAPLAAERAKAAVAAHDGSADAHLALALVAMANKDRPLALQELQRVVGLDPTVAEAHLALADSLAGAEPPQLERALEEIDAYLRIAPKGPDAPVAKKYQAMLRAKLEQ